MADRRVLRLGIRYGVAAVALSFSVGIVMSVNSGRKIGDEGNLLVSHGLGVHGIQPFRCSVCWSRRPPS